MSILNQLHGKPKTYLVGGIELELKPLRLDDMSLMAIDQNATQKQQTEASMLLIKKTLKESIPDATDEEINNIGFQYIEELTNAIMDVNGLIQKNDS